MQWPRLWVMRTAIGGSLAHSLTYKTLFNPARGFLQAHNLRGS